MNNIILLLMAFTVANVSAQNKDDNRGYIVNVGDMAPNFSAKLIDGRTFNLKDYQGKVVMLQFTASWCGVCRKEMPYIEDEIWLASKNKDFIIVGIDRDEPLEKVTEFVAQTKVTYPIALDPDANIFGLYAHKNAGVTRNVIIDKNGKIVYLTRLFNREEFDAMKEKIAALLQE